MGEAGSFMASFRLHWATAPGIEVVMILSRVLHVGLEQQRVRVRHCNSSTMQT